MSNLSNGILGTLAAAITFSAIQFASGNDLSAMARDSHNEGRAVQSSMVEGQSSVNRSAKADRFAGAARPSGQDKTFLFRVDHMPDTSVLVRVFAVRIEPSISSGRTTKTAISKRSTLACEPVVSVLTDVAKVLEPGRCLT